MRAMIAECSAAEPAGDTLAELAKLGETRTWEVGTAVMSEGAVADCMYLIHEGELRAVVAGADGRVVELNTLHEGEFFGQMMLGAALRNATVEVTRRARLTRIGRAEIESLMSTRPELVTHLVQSLVQRALSLAGTVRSLASLDVYGRLAGLFEALAVQDKGERVVQGSMSQQRIAERVGASRGMVNRLLRDLEDGGYIRVSIGRIVLIKKLPLNW